MQKGEFMNDNFVRRMLATVGAVAVVAVLIALVVVAADVLILAYTGLLFALMLGGLAHLLSRFTGAPYKLSVLLTLATMVIGTVVLVQVLGPQITDQLEELADSVPEMRTELEDQLNNYSWGQELLDRGPTNQNVNDLLFGTGQGGIFSRVTGVVSSTFGILTNGFVILFIGIYLAFEPEYHLKNLLLLVPPGKRQDARDVLNEAGYVMQMFLVVRFVSMVFVGIVTTIVLWVLGMPLALTLGIITFFFNFIPTFGPFIAAVPAVLVAITVSPTMVLYVIIAYFVIQQIDNYMVAPITERRAMSLPHALVLIAQLIFGVLVGLLGLAVAPPLVAAGIIMVKRLYVEDILGDEVESDARKDE
jgi:predicted PurR-regulated permease PerM